MNPKSYTVLATIFGWQIRYFSNGWFDAAQVDGPGLSPGLDSYQAVVDYIGEQRAIARAHQNNEPSALRRAFS